MARIQIKNLPKDHKISRDDMRKVFGGNVIPSKYHDPIPSEGVDSQLANFDMQNNLQQQQHTIQMLSNISRILRDTRMGVIRKYSG